MAAEVPQDISITLQEIYLSISIFVVLEIEPRVFCILGKHSPAKPHSSALKNIARMSQWEKAVAAKSEDLSSTWAPQSGRGKMTSQSCSLTMANMYTYTTNKCNSAHQSQARHSLSWQATPPALKSYYIRDCHSPVL